MGRIARLPRSEWAALRRQGAITLKKLRLRHQRRRHWSYGSALPLMARCIAFVAVSFIAACSTVPVADNWKRAKTYALENPCPTFLHRLYVRHAEANRGKSGFALIKTGREYYQTLTALTRIAQKTLDLQYYKWSSDTTGRLLLASVLDAARRGVRVRLLLDDMDNAWKDRELEQLSALPNVEIRLFNPFAGRDTGLLDFIFDFDRIDHRMHNKAFIADNSVAVVGGRNVGNQYFEINKTANYRDLDLFASGPIVRDISDSFDNFWNSAWSVSIARIDHLQIVRSDFARLHRKLMPKDVGTSTKFRDFVESDEPPRQRVGRLLDESVWTNQATLLADRASKPSTSTSNLLREARIELKGALKRDLLLETAYLIPGDKGVAQLCRLVHRGIHVRILTNSMASNDVVAAYAGYRKFRFPLLRCGVELYEMRADPQFVRREWNWVKPKSSANLHTKATVLDGKDVIIGSFNMDPRSARLNTEIALLVRNRRLAGQVSAFIEAGMAPSNAYQLKLEHGSIVWIGGGPDHRTPLHAEPGGDVWRTIVSDAISLLPIDGQL